VRLTGCWRPKVFVKMIYSLLPCGNCLRDFGHLSKVAMAKTVAHIKLAFYFCLAELRMGIQCIAKKAVPR